jgi:hypothetical protein
MILFTMARWIPLDVIVTDANGVPFERPEPPGKDATHEERDAYVRARYAYNDAVTDSANKSFATAFKGG